MTTPNDINTFDENDIGLKGIFGDRFHDETAESPSEAPKIQKASYTNAAAKAAQKPAGGFKDCESWEPVKCEPTFLDNLKACAKNALIFGGLSLLIFYWQQAGLMADSIAVPSMCVCAALAGWGAGRSFVKECRR